MTIRRTSAAWFAAALCIAPSLVRAQPGQSQALRGPGLDPAMYYAIRLRADSARAGKRYAQADSLYATLVGAYAVDPDIWESKAATQTSMGDLAGALLSWQGAWRAGAWPRGEVAYIIAQLNARLDKHVLALDWIDTALANRLERRPRLLTDTIFAALRTNARFIRQSGAVLPGSKRDAGWRHDIAYFVEEAQRLHVGAARPAFSALFLDAAKRLSRDVPTLSDTEIKFGLMRLARQLGDGHSYLVPRAPIVPIQLYQFADGLHIVQGTGAGAPLVGAQVIRIGRVDADSAMKIIARTASADNEITAYWLGVSMLLSPSALHQLGISSDSARVPLDIIDRNGRRLHVDLSPEPWMPTNKLRAPVEGPAPTPLWLQRTNVKHWLAAIPEMRAVYAQYNDVGNDAKGTVAQFADSINGLLASTNATSLIVDVRHNNGGRRQLNTPLLVAMAAFRRASPVNRVFVITSRVTFSAAQIFVSQAEWMARPIYVGEPTSSMPNFVGEESGVVLPYSEMRGSVSSQMHQGSTFQDTRPFIAPHIPVALTAKDYFANRDPVMETLGTLLRRPSTPLQP